jgi:hypothetical protein
MASLNEARPIKQTNSARPSQTVRITTRPKCALNERHYSAHIKARPLCHSSALMGIRLVAAGRAPVHVVGKLRFRHLVDREAKYCNAQISTRLALPFTYLADRTTVVDDEPDVEALFRQQFRRDIRDGRFTMDFAQSAASTLNLISDAAGASLILILSDINHAWNDWSRIIA